MTRDDSPLEVILALLLGGAFLVMLDGPLAEYSTVNLAFWGVAAIVVGIVLAVLLVGTAITSRM